MWEVAVESWSAYDAEIGCCATENNRLFGLQLKIVDNNEDFWVQMP